MINTGPPEAVFSVGVLREVAHGLIFSHVGPVPLTAILSAAMECDVSPHLVVREIHSVRAALDLAGGAVSREQVIE